MLADKDYISQCVNTLTCAWGNGRTIIASLKYRW
jgi:hypothetical protein